MRFRKSIRFTLNPPLPLGHTCYDWRMKFLSNVFVMLCIMAIYFPIAFLLFPVPETAFGLFAFFAAPIFIAWLLRRK